MLLEEIKKELDTLKKENRYRKIKTNSNYRLNFSSNDYLGLNEDMTLREEFYKQYENVALSSSSSRLIDGSYEIVMDLEKKLEEIYSKSALVFNSGYDANSSIIETFYNKKSLIISDRLNHASIYDGILHSNAKLLRYKHLDIEMLESLLEKYSKDYDDILIVSETIYSMDGDAADISALVELKKKYSFNLMIDEAHSYGVHSYGIAYNQNLLEYIDFLVIPLGKAGASLGAYVLTNSLYKEYLINKSRKFIYSTALAPINNAWNLFVLENMPSFKSKIEKLERLKNYTLNLLKELDLETISNSHIISIVIGNNEKLTRLSENLQKKSFLVYGIKEPTVPKDSSRLRLSLNANMEEEDINIFLKELKNEITTLF